MLRIPRLYYPTFASYRTSELLTYITFNIMPMRVMSGGLHNIPFHK